MSVRPYPLVLDSIRTPYFPLPVLHPLLPVSFINLSVRPLDDSKTMLFVFVVVTRINSAIGPLESTFSVHLVIFPFAFVLFAIGPDHSALALDFVFIKLALVLGHIRPNKLANAMLKSVVVLPSNKIQSTLHKKIHQAIFRCRIPLGHLSTTRRCSWSRRNCSRCLCHGLYRLSSRPRRRRRLDESVCPCHWPCCLSSSLRTVSSLPRLVCPCRCACLDRTRLHTWYYFPFRWASWRWSVPSRPRCTWKAPICWLLI